MTERYRFLIASRPSLGSRFADTVGGMDINDAVQHVNDALTHVAYHGDKTQLQFQRDGQDVDEFKQWSVTGTLSDGRDVRIEIREWQSELPAYRWSVWVYDADSGDPIGRGNGGATLKDAIDVYQWQALGI